MTGSTHTQFDLQLQARARLIAWSGWALSILLSVLGLWLLALTSNADVGERFGPRGFSALLALAFSTIGALIASRRPRNVIGWLFCWIGLGSGIQVFAEEYAIYAVLVHPGALPAGILLAWVAGWLYVPVTGPIMTFLLLLFPTGSLLSPRWRPVAWLSGLLLVVLTLTAAFGSGVMGNAAYLVNSFPLFSPSVALFLYRVGQAALLVCVVLSAASLIQRWRQARGEERQQLKWLAYAAVVTVPGTAAGFYNTQWGPPALITAMLLIPIAVGVAVLRYRLFAIDFLINRSLVYGALTALLGGVFAGGFFLLRAILERVLGTEQNVVAAIAATAIVVLLFNPTRRWLLVFVDRRFYGIQIEYTPAPAPASIGAGRTHFGPYAGLELIGRGGMAEVYKAVDSKLNRPMAIKILGAALVADQDFRKRFEREAKTASALKHPNIAQVFDFGEVDGTPYMVMEYIAGKDLGEYLRTKGRLPMDQSLLLLKGIASALDYAHQQGLVHRDIKPSNVLLDVARPVLTDFGIAKMVGGHTRYTQTGGVLGTLDYIAPEQIQGAQDIDGRADVYSFGVMVYQMLTGGLPFKHHNAGALLIAHLTEPSPDPREIAPDLSKETANVVRRAMAKNPDDRFGTAGEFVAALG